MNHSARNGLGGLFLTVGLGLIGWGYYPAWEAQMRMTPLGLQWWGQTADLTFKTRVNGFLVDRHYCAVRWASDGQRVLLREGDQTYLFPLESSLTAWMPSPQCQP